MTDYHQFRTKVPPGRCEMPQRESLLQYRTRVYQLGLYTTIVGAALTVGAVLLSNNERLKKALAGITVGAATGTLVSRVLVEKTRLEER